MYKYQLKTKIKTLLVGLCLIVSAMFMLTGSSYAAECSTGTPDSQANCERINNGTGSTVQDEGIPPVEDRAFKGCADARQEINKGCGIVEKYINPAINVFAGVAGIAVAGMIIFGAIEFASSGGDPKRAAQGKGRIVSAIVALLAFLFLYAFLQWLVPGGL